ncbi:unnamed protein product [Trichobilharzia regenti]|nr:unnamed protein product [Trichobilharzia regenti]
MFTNQLNVNNQKIKGYGQDDVIDELDVKHPHDL